MTTLQPTNPDSPTVEQKLRSDLSIMIEYITPDISDKQHIALLDGLSTLLHRREREAEVNVLNEVYKLRRLHVVDSGESVYVIDANLVKDKRSNLTAYLNPKQEEE